MTSFVVTRIVVLFFALSDCDKKLPDINKPISLLMPVRLHDPSKQVVCNGVQSSCVFTSNKLCSLAHWDGLFQPMFA